MANFLIFGCVKSHEVVEIVKVNLKKQTRGEKDFPYKSMAENNVKYMFLPIYVNERAFCHWTKQCEKLKVEST